MSQHTPGPWRTGREDTQSFDGATGQPFSSVYATDKRAGTHMGEQLPLVIATVSGEHVPREEEKANARLIAAAPELAEMIREFLDAAQSVPVLKDPPFDVPQIADAIPFMEAMDKARALLAQVDGAP